MKRWILNCFIIVMFFIFLGSFTYTHERVHSMIGNTHGCVDDSIQITWYGGCWTCHEYKPVSEEMKMNEIKLHMTHEIVSYNAMFIYGVLVVILLAFVKTSLEE